MSTLRHLLKLLIILSTGTPLYADNFGRATDRFTIEFVTIGDPGNAPDPQLQFTNNEREAEDVYEYDDNTATDVLVRRGKIFSSQFAPGKFGSVGYEFRIGKFEVSRDAVLKANRLGNLGITFQDIAPDGQRQPNDQPATGISWHEAARFVNWLNVSRGYPPAYKFKFQPGQVGYNTSFDSVQRWKQGDLGFDAANPYRNSRAVYFLPNEDEWYKAAYYDSVSRRYYAYPTGSDELPSPVLAGSAAGTAVFTRRLTTLELRLLQRAALRPGTTVTLPDFPTLPASIFHAGGPSRYGTFAQGGNAQEWLESPFNGALSSGLRTIRGGAWSEQDSFRNLNMADARSLRILAGKQTSDLLLAAMRLPGNPRYGAFNTGFRVASVSARDFYPPSPLPPPSFLPPPVVPDSAFVSTSLDGGLFYRDSKNEFLLGVNFVWDKFATPQQVRFAVTPLARYLIATWDEETGALEGEEMEDAPVPGASIEFDLDGDGLYETRRFSPPTSDSSVTLTTRRLPKKNGAHRIRARWLAPSGEWIVAESRVYVGMEPGVSILDGDEFTNRLRVQLSLFAPVGSAGALLSNDGGFRRGTRTVSFARVTEPSEPILIDWDLPRADNGRGSRVVYVRYVDRAGRALIQNPYSDDIIYDATAPVITQAALSAEPGPSARSRRMAGQITLNLRARDDRSGVQLMQLSRGARASSRGAQTFKYSTRRNIPKAGGPVWVRVQDKAGNWSAWRKSAAAKPKAVDREPPKLILTQPARGTTAATTKAFFNIQITATDDVSATLLRYRVLGPGKKSPSAWQSVALPGGDQRKQRSQRVNLSRSGLWRVDLQVFDAQGKSSPIRTARIRKR